MAEPALVPAGGPDQVKQAVRAAGDARVAHQLLDANARRDEPAAQTRPAIAVAAVREVQPVQTVWLAEAGEEEDLVGQGHRSNRYQIRRHRASAVHWPAREVHVKQSVLAFSIVLIAGITMADDARLTQPFSKDHPIEFRPNFPDRAAWE